jgi:hypothetical protein
VKCFCGSTQTIWIDKIGKTHTAGSYGTHSEIINGYGIVCKTQGSGLLYKYNFVLATAKSQWNRIAPKDFDMVWGNMQEGLLAVQDGNQKWGYIDTKGKLFLPYKYEWAFSFSNNMACIYFNRKMGYIDRKGNLIQVH